MRKIAERFFWTPCENDRDSVVEINKTLSENNTCYVLITCGEPSQDGKMNVEMTYGGDPVLAAYLVESAQTIIDTEIVSPSCEN